MTLTIPTEVIDLVRHMLGADHGQLPDAAVTLEVREAFDRAADDPDMTPPVLAILAAMAHAGVIGVQQATGCDHATALDVLVTVATRALVGSTAP